MRAFALGVLLVATPVTAQEELGNDPRYRMVEYRTGGVFQLPVSSETPQTILFAPGERILSVLLGDPGDYSVSVSGSGDSLLLQVKGNASPTIMNVRTDMRSYEIELIAGGYVLVPHVIHFSRSKDAQPTPEDLPLPEPLAGTSYRISGSRELRPASISDDGSKTFIVWRDDQAMPAIFALGPTGQEEMVDGYVRAGVFTIDRVYRRIVFRIDRKTATARRIFKNDE